MCCLKEKSEVKRGWAVRLPVYKATRTSQQLLWLGVKLHHAFERQFLECDGKYFHHT